MIENNGCNKGVQAGEVYGDVVINQGATPEEIESIIANAVKQYRQSNSYSGDQKSRQKKWFRYDTGREVKPDELIVSENITVQLDENIARAEVRLPDNETIYAEYDIEKNQINNIVGDGFPQEYSIHIPPEILISKKTLVWRLEGQNYNIDQYLLKFGGHLLAAYDIKDNKLQGIEAKAPAGMKAHVDSTTKTITFVKNECSF